MKTDQALHHTHALSVKMVSHEEKKRLPGMNIRVDLGDPYSNFCRVTCPPPTSARFPRVPPPRNEHYDRLLQKSRARRGIQKDHFEMKRQPNPNKHKKVPYIVPEAERGAVRAGPPRFKVVGDFEMRRQPNPNKHQNLPFIVPDSEKGAVRDGPPGIKVIDGSARTKLFPEQSLVTELSQGRLPALSSSPGSSDSSTDRTIVALLKKVAELKEKKKRKQLTAKIQKPQAHGLQEPPIHVPLHNATQDVRSTAQIQPRAPATRPAAQFGRRPRNLWPRDLVVKVRNGPRIVLSFGDIEKQRVDAVVNAANERLAHGSGVCGAIYGGAGRELDRYMQQNHSRGTATGTAVISPAFRLPASFIVHAVGPDVRGTGFTGKNDRATKRMDGLLAATYESSLRACEKKGLKSIAFPSISTGIFQYPLLRGARVAVGSVFKRKTTLEEIRFIAYDDEVWNAYVDAFNHFRLHGDDGRSPWLQGW